MSGVPNIFANATVAIPLVQLDQNFATQITLGNTTMGLGNVTAAITPNSTVGIVGTTTNDSVQAGSVGEYIESDIAAGSGVTLTTGTTVNMTSINLTAGDWDVTFVAQFACTNATNVGLELGVSTTSATFDVSLGRFQQISEGVSPLTFTPGGNVPVRRFSLAGNTTIYGVVLATFGGGSIGAYGNLSARRVR